MAYIEGIGNEVVVVFATVSFILFLILGWLSTRVTPNPLRRVIIHRQTVPVPVSVPVPVPAPDTSNNERAPESVPQSRGNVGGDLAENNPNITQEISDDNVSRLSASTELTLPSQSEVGSNEKLREVCGGSTPQIGVDSSVDASMESAPVERTTVDFLAASDQTNSPSPTVYSSSDNELPFSSQGATSDNSSQRLSSSSSQNQGPVVVSLTARQSAGAEGSSHSRSSSRDRNLASVVSDVIQNSIETSTVPSDGPRGSQQPPSGKIRVIVRNFQQGDREVLAHRSDTIHQFRREHFPEDPESGQTVKFIFNGQVLVESRTLLSYNVVDSTVVHIHLSRAPQHPMGQGGGGGGGMDEAAREAAWDGTRAPGWDPVAFMFPLLGVALLLVWYLRLVYKHMFTFTSSILLLFLTLVFGFTLYVSRRHGRLAPDETPQADVYVVMDDAVRDTFGGQPQGEGQADVRQRRNMAGVET